jgi:hypothetical protein
MLTEDGHFVPAIRGEDAFNHLCQTLPFGMIEAIMKTAHARRQIYLTGKVGVRPVTTYQIEEKKLQPKPFECKPKSAQFGPAIGQVPYLAKDSKLPPGKVEVGQGLTDDAIRKKILAKIPLRYSNEYFTMLGTVEPRPFEVIGSEVVRGRRRYTLLSYNGEHYPPYITYAECNREGTGYDVYYQDGSIYYVLSGFSTDRNGFFTDIDMVLKLSDEMEPESERTPQGILAELTKERLQLKRQGTDSNLSEGELSLLTPARSEQERLGNICPSTYDAVVALNKSCQEAGYPFEYFQHNAFQDNGEAKRLEDGKDFPLYGFDPCGLDADPPNVLAGLFIIFDRKEFCYFLYDKRRKRKKFRLNLKWKLPKIPFPQEKISLRELELLFSGMVKKEKTPKSLSLEGRHDRSPRMSEMHSSLTPIHSALNSPVAGEKKGRFLGEADAREEKEEAGAGAGARARTGTRTSKVEVVRPPPLLIDALTRKHRERKNSDLGSFADEEELRGLGESMEPSSGPAAATFFDEATKNSLGMPGHVPPAPPLPKTCPTRRQLIAELWPIVHSPLRNPSVNSSFATQSSHSATEDIKEEGHRFILYPPAAYLAREYSREFCEGLTHFFAENYADAFEVFALSEKASVESCCSFDFLSLWSTPSRKWEARYALHYQVLARVLGASCMQGEGEEYSALSKALAQNAILCSRFPDDVHAAYNHLEIQFAMAGSEEDKFSAREAYHKFSLRLTIHPVMREQCFKRIEQLDQCLPEELRTEARACYYAL